MLKISQEDRHPSRRHGLQAGRGCGMPNNRHSLDNRVTWPSHSSLRFRSHDNVCAGSTHIHRSCMLHTHAHARMHARRDRECYCMSAIMFCATKVPLGWSHYIRVYPRSGVSSISRGDLFRVVAVCVLLSEALANVKVYCSWWDGAFSDALL